MFWHHGTSFDPKTYLIGNIAVITGIPSGIKRQGLFFPFIAYTKKREKNLKPCGKIM
jgi:hypothetical protein